MTIFAIRIHNNYNYSFLNLKYDFTVGEVPPKFMAYDIIEWTKEKNGSLKLQNIQTV